MILRWIRLRAWWLPVPLVLVVAGVVAAVRWPDSAPSPVDVEASGPRFTSLDELVAASDLIVVARVERTTEGRVFTDPSDPASGVRTQLADLAVEGVRKGEAVESVVLEEEAELLDGRPITVDGAAPSKAGDRGVYFLIASDEPDAPFHALIGQQGRFLIDGDELRTAARDPLSRELAPRGLDSLLERL